MKNKIIIGSLIAVFILITPTALPALEYEAIGRKEIQNNDRLEYKLSAVMKNFGNYSDEITTQKKSIFSHIDPQSGTLAINKINYGYYIDWFLWIPLDIGLFIDLWLDHDNCKYLEENCGTWMDFVTALGFVLGINPYTLPIVIFYWLLSALFNKLAEDMYKTSAENGKSGAHGYIAYSFFRQDIDYLVEPQ